MIKEGEVEAKAYEEYLQWCQSAVQDTGFAIETATKEKGELEAKITELSAQINEAGSKTEDLAAAISTNEADLKSATGIREKEIAKNPASFAQVYNKNVKNILQTLSLVADAAA